ncbi:MAG: LacI family DNA-binding transcriptional regulator [Ktedonobacterales bacterium]
MTTHNQPDPSRADRPRRATLTEVAAALGVSHTTVSNAFNRPDQLSPEMRARVLETAARLGYAGPDPAARSLRRGRAGAVGVLYSDRLSYAFADPAAALFLDGLAAATEEADLNLLLIPGAARRDPASVVGAVVDGFLIYTMATNDPLVTAALDRRLPTVVVDQPRRDDIPWVGIDEERSTGLAAAHLLSLGHRRFGVITFRLSPETVSGFADQCQQNASTYQLTRARLRGYAQTLAHVGIRWDTVPVYACAENGPAEGRAAAAALLALEPRPTAILATSDQLAIGALDAARQLGLTVPGDVSVVGFDDSAPATHSTPPLTTIHQPIAEKGLLAGRLLIARLRGEGASPSQTLPTHLVIRASTAPPPSR